MWWVSWCTVKGSVNELKQVIKKAMNANNEKSYVKIHSMENFRESLSVGEGNFR